MLLSCVCCYVTVADVRVVGVAVAVEVAVGVAVVATAAIAVVMHVTGVPDVTAAACVV